MGGELEATRYGDASPEAAEADGNYGSPQIPSLGCFKNNERGEGKGEIVNIRMSHRMWRSVQLICEDQSRFEPPFFLL